MTADLRPTLQRIAEAVAWLGSAGMPTGRCATLLLDVHAAWERARLRHAGRRRDGWPDGGDSAGGGGVARPTEVAAVSNAADAVGLTRAGAEVLAAAARLDAACWGDPTGLRDAEGHLRAALGALDAPDVDDTPGPEAESRKADLRCDGGRVPGTHPCEALAVHDEWIGGEGQRGTHVRLCGPCLDAWRAERRRSGATERKRRQRERDGS